MNKPLAIGCIVISAILAILATVGVLVGPRLFKLGASTLKSVVEEASRVGEFEARWTPPGPTLDASWFPKTVAQWELEGDPAPVTRIPELNLDSKGLAGSYASNGEKVEVAVLPANSLEREALLARAKEAIGQGNGARSSKQFGDRYSFTVNETERTVLWWLKGYLFVFRTHGNTDPAPFAETYLGAISSAPEPKAAATPTPE